MRTGFVAGCIWGDDSSGKVQVVDLSNVAANIIAREARFGYCELPDGRSLRDVLNFREWSPEYPNVIVIRQDHRDLAPGTPRGL